LAGYLAGAFGPLPSAVPQVLLVWPDPIAIVVLTYCGVMPAEGPYIQWVVLEPDRAAYYFAHFLIILPIVSRIEKPLPLPNSITEAVTGKAASNGCLTGKDSIMVRLIAFLVGVVHQRNGCSCRPGITTYWCMITEPAFQRSRP
jgi:hypothetical protein